MDYGWVKKGRTRLNYPHLWIIVLIKCYTPSFSNSVDKWQFINSPVNDFVIKNS